MSAVFSNGTQFLYPGPDSEFNDHVTQPTFSLKEKTDISQDFEIINGFFIKVRIPEGATKLFFTAHDSNFANNSDPDGDFGVTIKMEIVRSSGN